MNKNMNVSMYKDNSITIEDYEIIHSIHIGDRELIIGENMNDSNNKHYMTCYAERDFLHEYYYKTIINEDFVEIAKIFAERLIKQVERTKEAEDRICTDRKVINSEMCNTDVFGESFIGKILVVKPDALRPEYRTDVNQLIFCKNGNGASPQGHGSSIYGDYLATGEKAHFYRTDILGELKPEHYPKWAKNRIEIVKEFYKNEKVFEYGGKLFLGVGVFPPKKERDFSRTLRTDRNLTFEIKTGEEFKYSHRNFINASRDEKSDVFRCYENGKLYVPGENELFEYTGKYRSLDSISQQKKKASKEPER